MRSALLLACIISAFTVSLCDWHHPDYSFRCLENGDVELFGLHNGSIIKMHNSENCIKNYPANGDRPVTIKRNCLHTNDTKKGFSTVNIIVYDPDFDGTTTTPTPPTLKSTTKCMEIPCLPVHNSSCEPTRCSTLTLPTSTSTSSYKGGRGTRKFTIKCLDIPDTGVNKTVAHVFQETESNVLPENYKEVDGVEMRFKAAKNPEAPDISSIYVGDEFYMYIKYMGTKKYWVVPEKCLAFKGPAVPKGPTAESSTSVLLWTNKEYGCVKHNELLESFGRVNKTLVYAKMYGFRFTDEEYVTITCDVTMYPNMHQKVCRNPTTTPALTTTRTTPPTITTTTPTTKTTTTQANGRRKRRSITTLAPKKPLAPKASPYKPFTPIRKDQLLQSEYGRHKRDIGYVKFQTHSVFKKMRVFDNKDIYQLENKSQHNACGISVWICALFTVTLYRQWI